MPVRRPRAHRARLLLLLAHLSATAALAQPPADRAEQLRGLVEQLKHQDRELRAQAINGLRPFVYAPRDEAESRTVLLALVGVLSKGDEAVVAKAWPLLWHLTTKVESAAVLRPAFGPLVALLGRENASARRRAGILLGSVVPFVPAATVEQVVVQPLLQQLSADEVALRRAAACGLGPVGGGVTDTDVALLTVAPLLRATHDEDSQTRADAATSLGDLAQVRAEAEKALGQVGASGPMLEVDRERRK